MLLIILLAAKLRRRIDRERARLLGK